MKFIGREKELESINEKLNSSKSEFIIVYGRRRLGKSTLLKESLKNKQNPVYYLCVEENIRNNLKYFKEELSQSLNNQLFFSTQAETFVEYFQRIQDLIPENQIFCFDEFPYILRQNQSILSQFQKIFDEYLKPKNCKLIICGSALSTMSDLMTYRSPLYGRRTLSIKLKPFSLKETKKILQNITDTKEIIKYYGIFGGVPYYLEQINQELSFEENFRNFFFENKGFFFDETTFLLKEEVKEIRNYKTIIKAIAKGKTTFSEIEHETLIDKSSLAKYIEVLENLDLIEKYLSIFDKPRSKKSRYGLKDNFIDFWFSVIEKNISSIHNRQRQEEILSHHFQTFMGKTFERICYQRLKKHYEIIGTYFKKEVEIDIVGINGNKVDLFECKFRENINEEQELKKLKEKIQYLPQEYTYNTHIISINSKKYNLEWLFSIN